MMSKTPTFKPILAPTTVKEESRETNEPSEEELFGTNQRKYLGHYKDFIGVYNKILSPDFCGEVMDAFEQYQRNNSIWQEDVQFPNSNAGRMDWAMDLYQLSNQCTNAFLSRELNDVLIKCLDEYIHTFGHLKQNRFYSTCQKVQKTPAGGGYHIWHDENASYVDSARKMVWLFYLNDNYEGGETEFLYYKKRIQPEAGTLLIWPAGLTHCHRGGMVVEGTKFVITGWYYLMP